jgi:hypothetical protein
MLLGILQTIYHAKCMNIFTIYYSARNVTFLALVFTSLAPTDLKLKKIFAKPSKYYLVLYKNLTLIQEAYHSSAYICKSELQKLATAVITLKMFACPPYC